MKRFAVACLLLVSSAAYAGSPDGENTAKADQSTASKPAKKDRMICEEQEELGSRLQSHRVCMRASEWAERRRLERMDVQKSQVQGLCTEGC